MSKKRERKLVKVGERKLEGCFLKGTRVSYQSYIAYMTGIYMLRVMRVWWCAYDRKGYAFFVVDIWLCVSV